MSIPIVPLLKLIALGSIKIIFLGLGALIVPVLTVRLVVGGTGESIRLATQWMVDHGKMEQAEADTFLACLKEHKLNTQTNAVDGTVWAMLLLLSLLWGGSFIFVELALRDLQPLTIVASLH